MAPQGKLFSPTEAAVRPPHAPSVPFGVRDEVAYLKGKATVLELVRRAGFDTRDLVELPVRWSDQDPNNHVNNVMFMNWAEMGRLSNMVALCARIEEQHGDLGFGPGRPHGLVLASISTRFIKPVYFPDNVAVVHRVQSVGEKKFELTSHIYSYTQEALVATGTATMVSFDFVTNRTVPWPALVHKELAAQAASAPVAAKL